MLLGGEKQAPGTRVSPVHVCAEFLLSEKETERKAIHGCQCRSHDKALQCISALFTPTLCLSLRLHTNYV